MKRAFLAVAVVLIWMTGASAATSSETKPAALQPQPPATVQADSELSGKVVETMNGGGYTYACIEKNGKKTWVAIPMTEIKVGQQATFRPGAEMVNFTSKSLNRTFDSIIFSAGMVGGTPAKPAAAPAEHNPKKAMAAGSAEKIKVDKATGPDAYTVSEIHEKAASLNKKTAVVRAKVVKVSEGIMGKNWIHLQDGTGEAAKGNNKLVATSQDSPAVGDVVTIKGTVYKDKDFGSGYRYSVIMEQATVQH